MEYVPDTRDRPTMIGSDQALSPSEFQPNAWSVYWPPDRLEVDQLKL